jgi:hypothetical protein
LDDAEATAELLVFDGSTGHLATSQAEDLVAGFRRLVNALFDN